MEAEILIFDIILFQSILGMHIFGCKFSLRTDTGDTVPDRKNFDSLLWAIVTVFQVSPLCSLWVAQGKVKRIRSTALTPDSTKGCVKDFCVMFGGRTIEYWNQTTGVYLKQGSSFLPRRWCAKVSPVVATPKFNTLTSAHDSPNGCSCFFLLS